jgi:CRISPR-associated protein Cas5t
MQALIIELTTQSSTFRNPDFQNFHKSYQLPPPTTLVGLAGAAMGLSPMKSQEFFEDNWVFGVYGETKGKANDLWKFTKDIRTQKKDILTKEILYFNSFIIVFSSENLDKIEKLKNAFESPKYALTLGNSDSIAKIMNIEISDFFEKSKMVKNCLIGGDIISEVISNMNNDLAFSIYNTSEPITYDLPVKFKYKSEYGERSISKRKKYLLLVLK